MRNLSALTARLLSSALTVAFLMVLNSRTLAQTGPVPSQSLSDLKQARASIEKTLDLLSSRGFQMKLIDAGPEHISFDLELPRNIFPELKLTATITNKDRDHFTLDLHAERKSRPGFPAAASESKLQPWKLSPAEFQKADVNHDGSLGESEFTAYLKLLDKERRHLSSLRVDLTKSDRAEEAAANAAVLNDQLSLFIGQIANYDSKFLQFLRP